eukprot:TRINITY_DN5660_c0_g2_i1.p1 TRINITY_DN5660_c0_g2~~TRINITY_DN5660_c0_g2_i1.p1  ORF type:complete len:465 (+),score=90.26 TRINITY_DN5660_c0_g2_i1:142-1536(+)
MHRPHGMSAAAAAKTDVFADATAVDNHMPGPEEDEEAFDEVVWHDGEEDDAAFCSNEVTGLPMEDGSDCGIAMPPPPSETLRQLPPPSETFRQPLAWAPAAQSRTSEAAAPCSSCRIRGSDVRASGYSARDVPMTPDAAEDSSGGSGTTDRALRSLGASAAAGSAPAGLHADDGAPRTGHVAMLGEIADTADGAGISDAPDMPDFVASVPRSPSGVMLASSESHANRRIRAAAATVGGTAGLLLGGPLTGAVAGAVAVYATTREDAVGTISRRAGGVFVSVQDAAIDKGLQVMDKAAQEGRTALVEQADNQKVPAPMRRGIRQLLQEPAPDRNSDFESNREEVRRIFSQYPGRVPVICLRSTFSDLPELPKKKFILPDAMLFGEFKYIVHKQLQQLLTRKQPQAEQTIYLFVNGVVLKTNTPMSEVYERHKADDGFLYISYGVENSLGSPPLRGLAAAAVCRLP